MPVPSREVRLARRPVGVPTAADFELAEVTLPDPGAGELLVRNLWMSVDPYMRGRMNDVKSYTPPFALGEAMQGGAIGRVEASNNPSSASATTFCTALAGANTSSRTDRASAR